MKQNRTHVHAISRSIFTYIAVAALVLMSAQAVLMPSFVDAAILSNRSITLGSSAPSASTTHEFDFTIGTTNNVGSIIFDYCTSADGACTPAAVDVSGVSISNQSGAGAMGFAVDASTDTNTVVIDRTPASISATTAVSYTFSTAVNSSTANETFFVRISTTDAIDGGGTTVDNGVVAGSTSEEIQLTGQVDETLVFCTGTSITGANCASISGGAVNLGTFSSLSPNTGTSVMAASTNGTLGYSITVNGSTLTCNACSGSPTIGALTAPTASSPGNPQYGLNLVDNTSPNVGANVSPLNNGTNYKGQPTADYGADGDFKFVTGNSVAASDDPSAGPTDAQAFTVSYLVNIPGSQAAGIY
ncbi:MAG: hypothetical protein ACRD4B_01120, partial [Acidobacteriota bacterium]